MRFPNVRQLALVLALGFCCGFLIGCDRSSAISDLRQDQADHAHSLGKAWDTIKALKAEAEALRVIDNSLAKRIENQRNDLDHTAAKADCAYDNNTALAAKLQKLEERIEKDQAELAVVLKQQDQAIEQLAARKPEPLPAPVAKPSPPNVEIVPANSKIISVAPVSCPKGKCCPRNQ